MLPLFSHSYKKVECIHKRYTLFLLYSCVGSVLPLGDAPPPESLPSFFPLGRRLPCLVSGWGGSGTVGNRVQDAHKAFRCILLAGAYIKCIFGPDIRMARLRGAMCNIPCKLCRYRTPPGFVLRLNLCILLVLLLVIFCCGYLQIKRNMHVFNRQVSGCRSKPEKALQYGDPGFWAFRLLPAHSPDN